MPVYTLRRPMLCSFDSSDVNGRWTQRVDSNVSPGNLLRLWTKLPNSRDTLRFRVHRVRCMRRPICDTLENVAAEWVANRTKVYWSHGDMHFLFFPSHNPVEPQFGVCRVRHFRRNNSHRVPLSSNWLSKNVCRVLLLIYCSCCWMLLRYAPSDADRVWTKEVGNSIEFKKKSGIEVCVTCNEIRHHGFQWHCRLACARVCGINTGIAANTHENIHHQPIVLHRIYHLKWKRRPADVSWLLIEMLDTFAIHAVTYPANVPYMVQVNGYRLGSLPSQSHSLVMANCTEIQSSQ